MLAPRCESVTSGGAPVVSLSAHSVGGASAGEDVAGAARRRLLAASSATTSD